MRALAELRRPDVSGVQAGSSRTPDLRWHRLLTLATSLLVLAGLRGMFIRTTSDVPGLGIVVSCCYVALLACAVAAATSRSRRGLVVADLVLLLVVVATQVVQFHAFAMPSYDYGGGDEGPLTLRAIEALRHGHSFYGTSWPKALSSADPTQLMGGGIVDQYDYPPLPVMLGAAGSFLWHGFGTPAVMASIALLATAVFAFAVLPVGLRPLAVLALFGMGFVVNDITRGASTLMAVPFLAVALWRWHRVGESGRLAGSDLLRAVAFGLAMSSQQLTWLILPFVVVGIWRLRRGSLDGRRAVGLVGRWVLVVAVTFAVVNLPFVLLQPDAWSHAVLSVFTQHAVIYGPGLAMISGQVLRGSGALGFYSFAMVTLYLAMLVIFARGIRRLGPVAPILPLLSLLVSVRSEDPYYILLAPVWILAVVGSPQEVFSTARPLGESLWWPRRRSATWAAGIALLVPATACLLVAILTPPPLRMNVVDLTRTPTGALQQITVMVDNRSNHSVTPHFSVVVNAQIGRFWRIQQGPPTLQPGGSATYLLTRPAGVALRQSATSSRLDAVADNPETLSATGL